MPRARPPARPRGLRGWPTGLSSPSWQVNGRPGPLPAAWLLPRPPRPKGAASSWGRAAGTRRGRSPGGHSLPWVPRAGRGKGGKSGTRGPPRWWRWWRWWWRRRRRRRTREPPSPGCQVAVLATHTLAGGSRSPQARAVVRAQVSGLFDPPDPCAGVALGRAFKCWLRLSNRG